MKRILILSFIGLIFSFNSLAYSQQYKVWIETEFKGSQLKIRPYFLNQTDKDISIRYKLKVKKIFGPGKTDCYQSGSFFIKRGEKKCLSKLKINISLDDYYKISLEVYKEGKLIAKDFIIYPKSKSILF